jgi:hypothetical protein
MEENVLFHGTADLISKKETIAIPGTRGASPAVVVRRSITGTIGDRLPSCRSVITAAYVCRLCNVANHLSSVFSIGEFNLTINSVEKFDV